MIKTIATIENIEVRGCEKKTSKAGKDYLIIHVDDEQGNRSDFMDRDLEREEFYKRGTVGNLKVRLDIGKYSNIEVLDFKITNA